MTNKPASTLDPVQFLKHVVALWPSRKEELPDTLDKLRPHLAEGFEAIDLLNRPKSVVDIEKVETTPQGGVTIYFYDEAEYLQRAELELSESGGWGLRSLKFQCPICFGTGENDGTSCTMCGGSGWGAS